MKILQRSILVLLLVTTTNAAVGTIETFNASRLNRDDSPEGWQIKVKSGTPRLIKISDGGIPGLCLSSTDASFSIQRDMVIDIAKHPFVTWRWRANMLPPRGDFRSSRTDDQAAQLLVAFEGRKTVAYIWDTNAPIDAVGEFSIPFVVSVRVLVVANKRNKLREWMEVTRNIGEDYRRLFGAEPGNIIGLRFQVNSQHTASQAEGCISRIAFHD